MQTENYIDLWEEICFVLHDSIKDHFTEKEFEFQVVRAMELLGWSEYRGEIERQRSIQIGSSGILRPDLVIYDRTKKPLIVVEVKRPQEESLRDEATSQLKSYMRQMKAEYGILIGVELRVYYDGSRNPQAEPLLLQRISFSREEPLGASFVRMFTKQNFISGEHAQFLDEKIMSFSIGEERRKLREKILSGETKQKIIEFLSEEFSDFGTELFLSVMKEVNICVIQCPSTPLPDLESSLNDLERTPMTQRPPRNTPKVDGQSKPLVGRSLTLQELDRKTLGKDDKPKAIIIDHKVVPVSNWTELTVRFVEWLILTKRLTEGDLPVLSYSETKYFINRYEDQKGEKDAYWSPAGRFFVDTKYNADGHKRNIIHTLKQLHCYDIDIRVSFR